jgi:phosphoglycerate kinase
MGAVQAGTQGILDACAAAKASGALVGIGGGDCGACAEKWQYADKISHISTGGGASLELLEGNPMPGLTALSDRGSIPAAKSRCCQVY